jgi:hypothetical protein
LTKKHKRMLKKMLDKPYTHEEAFEAGKWLIFYALFHITII